MTGEYSYIRELHLLLLIVASDEGMMLPDSVIADDSWWCMKWGNAVSMARSHGEPTIVVQHDEVRTEHTDAIHAVRRTKELLDSIPHI